MTRRKQSQRGSSTVEYGITLGAVTLLAASLFANTSAPITGIWRNAWSTSAKAGMTQSASTTTYAQCNQEAHKNSKICATENH